MNKFLEWAGMFFLMAGVFLLAVMIVMALGRLFCLAGGWECMYWGIR